MNSPLGGRADERANCLRQSLSPFMLNGTGRIGGHREWLTKATLKRR